MRVIRSLMMNEPAAYMPHPRAAIIVETPLQLLCGYEAQGHEEGAADIYIRLSGRGRNDQQLLSMVEEMFPIFETVDAPLRSLRIRSWAVFKMAIKLYRGRYERVYLGSYFSGFQRSVAKLYLQAETIFLDDGMATLLAQEKIAAMGDKVAPKVFSFFDLDPLPGQGVVKHEFERLRKIPVRETGKADLDRAAVFVGQPLVERGYVSKNTYLSAIRYAKKEARDRWLYYIPHRHEDGTIASMVNAIAGCSTIELDSCLEWYFLRNSAEPSAIFGFSSTALVTMPKLFPKVRSVAFDVEYRAYELPSHIENIRSYMKRDANINLIRWDGTSFVPMAGSSD